MKNLVYFPKIEFDIEYLKKLAFESKRILGRPNHHRLVSDDSYLSGIKEKYWFLSPIYNVYKFTELPIHIDAGRNCTLNIPLTNTEFTETIVYEKVKTDFTYIADAVLHRLDNTSNLKFLYKFSLCRPTLFNTTFPHQVMCNGYERISISWSVLSQYTFHQAINFFKELEL